ncbi:MAG: divergent PAP2 family protein [Anaerolineaceae bacterium]|nr:divergent PAP2 family protein [Anaerolineaceae bacterium]
MSPLGIFANRVLFVGLLAWSIAQAIKLPLEYLHTRRWNWSLLLSAGGMPSSHSALVVATTLAIGLFYGFDHPMFALGVAVTMVVTYDATNIRRQAGIHAQKINLIIEELFSGQPINEEQLKEVLGHTPLEVAGGIVLGSAVAVLAWFFSR